MAENQIIEEIKINKKIQENQNVEKQTLQFQINVEVPQKTEENQPNQENIENLGKIKTDWHYGLFDCFKRKPLVCLGVFLCYLPFLPVPGIICIGLQHFHSSYYWINFRKKTEADLCIETSQINPDTGYPYKKITQDYKNNQFLEMWCCQYVHRGEIRQKYNIRGNEGTDMLTFCFLPCCAAMQDINEIDYQNHL